MAARSPRKLFATSFVVTVASTACFTTSNPPPPQPPENPPPPVESRPTEPPPVPPTGPVQGGTVEAQPTQTYAFDQRWTVMKRGETCQAYAQVDCPKPKHPGDPVPTCNPPAPMKIECPTGWDGKTALTVVRYANQTECMVEPPPMKCPPNTRCNPPPPRRTACPTR